MATTQTSPSNVATATQTTRGYSLKLLVILAYAGIGIDNLFTLLGSQRIIPPVLILGILGLVGAGLAAIPWRWAPVPALVVGLALLGGILGNPFPLFALTHPGSERIPFISLTIFAALNLIGIVASVIMVVQLVRRQPMTPPRWASSVFTGLLGVGLGMLLLGTTASFSGTSTSTTGQGNHTEVVHLSSATFAPDIIALHTGETLTVVDDSPTPHILANGSWSASNQAQAATESGAPTINNVELNNNTKVFGPYTTPGTYHIYCTVHPGMNLTIVVQ